MSLLALWGYGSALEVLLSCLQLLPSELLVLFVCLLCPLSEDLGDPQWNHLSIYQCSTGRADWLLYIVEGAY